MPQVSCPNCSGTGIAGETITEMPARKGGTVKVVREIQCPTCDGKGTIKTQ